LKTKVIKPRREWIVSRACVRLPERVLKMRIVVVNPWLAIDLAGALPKIK
jgi:hypothetical protein